MPAYQFYRLSDLEAPPLQLTFFADPAAGRYALGAAFATGADVWQGTRFVGRFHGQPDETDEASATLTPI